jgi:mannose-6-phosphate isomerase-like protein (cupin superfamily)
LDRKSGRPSVKPKPYVVRASDVPQYEGDRPTRWIIPLINTSSCGATQLAANLYRLPPGETSMRDIHAEEEMYYVLGGKACLIMGDETFQVEAGMVVFIPPNCWHQSTNCGQEDLCYLCVFAPPPSGTPIYEAENWRQLATPAGSAEAAASPPR